MAQEQRAQEIILGTGVDYKPLDFSGLANFANKLNNRAYDEKIKREERKYAREAKAASLGDNLISPVFVNDLKNSYKDLEQQFIDNKITEAEFTGKIDGLIAKNNMYLQSEQQYKEMYGKDGMFLGVDENGNPINAYDSKLGELDGMLQGDNPEEAIKAIYQFRNGYVAPRKVSDIYNGILGTSTKLLNQMASENITDKINFDKATSIEEKVRYLTPKGKQIFLSNLENAHGLDIKEMYAQNNAGIDSFDKYKKDLFDGFTYMGSTRAESRLPDDTNKDEKADVFNYSNITEESIPLKEGMPFEAKNTKKYTFPNSIGNVSLDLESGEGKVVSDAKPLSIVSRKIAGSDKRVEMVQFAVKDDGSSGSYSYKIDTSTMPKEQLAAFEQMGTLAKDRDGKKTISISSTTRADGQKVIELPLDNFTKGKLNSISIGSGNNTQFFNVDNVVGQFTQEEQNNETQTPTLQKTTLDLFIK